jgi:hypothetical protein
VDATIWLGDLDQEPVPNRPDLDDEPIPLARLVTIVAVVVLISAALIVAMLISLLNYAEPRQWESIGLLTSVR